MSYSRWSDSRWYTYWSGPGEKFPIDDQTFTVCLDGVFTYRQLKDNLDQCLDSVCDDATAEEREELKEYALTFVHHMEESFKVVDV